MQLFLSTDIDQGNIVLDAIDSRHCIRVLRKTIGDNVKVTDGKGTLYSTKVIDPHPKHCLLSIVDEQLINPIFQHELHIAIAPTKNINRTEWFVEKAIEIGVTQITFISTKHSERNKINLERIQKIMVSAVKQSNQFYLPRITGIENMTDYITLIAQSNKKCFIAALTQNSTALVQQNLNQPITIMIGPEGGFHPEELAYANRFGFDSISLGPNKLRTETAGVYACSVIRSAQHMISQ